MKPLFPELDEERAERLISTAGKLGGLASAGCVGSRAGHGRSLEEVAARISARLKQAGVPLATADALSRETARESCDLIASAARNELKPRDVAPEQLARLEAVIRIIGRPAWFVKKNVPVEEEEEIDASDEFWLVHIGSQLAKIKRACARVCAIFKLDNGSKSAIGTGWMIGRGLIATNAHVARHLYYRRIGAPAGAPDGGWRTRPGVSALADFGFERDASSGSCFKVANPLFIEQDETSQPDIAILEIEPRDGTPPPSPLDLELLSRSGGAKGPVFAIGHPVADANSDPNVTAVFGALDGAKRFSPGEALGQLGDFVLAHDCSTTNGSSGSPILSFASGKVIGLHYWGQPGERNESIFVPALKDHPAILKSAPRLHSPELFR